MKKLKLKVTFQWVDIIDDSILKTQTEYLDNYEDVKKYVTLNSSRNLSCEILNILPHVSTLYGDS